MPQLSNTADLMRFFNIKTAYDPQMSGLHQYLKGGFDPYDYLWAIPAFLDEEEVAYDEDDEEAAEKWLAHASPEDVESFKNHIESSGEYGNYSDRPATEFFMHPSIATPDWLVHFTDDPYRIASEGFIYGHWSYEGLGLTTYYTDSARKREPGFNFALGADSRKASEVAADEKYGHDAVVFWGSGVEAYHVGDEEDQIVFWGPTVKPNMIFPILRGNSEWRVDDDEGRERKTGTFREVVDWVENNYRMLQQIRAKRQRRASTKPPDVGIKFFRISQDESEINDVVTYKRKWGRVGLPDVMVLKNPSMKDMRWILSEQEYGDEVGLLLTEQNVYAFRRDLDLHKNVARQLGLPEYVGVLYDPAGYAMVTDATTDRYRESPDAAILVRRMLPGVREVRYFNEDIVGPWDREAKNRVRFFRIAQDQYMQAVEAGDTDATRRMVHDAAKKAGYDTGPEYHGTSQKQFTVFDQQLAGTGPFTAHPIARHGFFFTPKQSMATTYAEGGSVISVYLDIGSSYRFDMFSGEALSWADERGIATADKVDPWIAKIKSRYDSVTLVMGDEVMEHMVFSPNKIKSADPVTYDSQMPISLDQRFNPSNPDIRY